MDLLLKGKRALISGSTAGIGLAIAEGLAREGATVTVNGRSKPRVAKYICSPLASATNGASLRVDGGVVRSII